MLLNIYLASTGAAIATDIITWMALVEKLKKEGYVHNKDKNLSILEKVYYGFASIANAWWTAVPVLNIIISLDLLSPDRMPDLIDLAKNSGAFVKSYDTMTREERLEELTRREIEIENERNQLEALKRALIVEQSNDYDAGLVNEGYTASLK